MKKDITRSAITLAKALDISVTQDDIDSACRTLQDVMGITDGGLAGVIFSDLDDNPDSSESWKSLSASGRRNRLVAYIQAEVDLMRTTGGDRKKINLTGFTQWHTGGGCMALAKRLADQSQWLVTDEDGTEIPCEGDEIRVGHYAEDGSILFEANYKWSEFNVENFLNRVVESEHAINTGDANS